MATKAELETELAYLREQNDALRAKADARAAAPADPQGTDGSPLPAPLREILGADGLGTADIETMGRQLGDELAKLQKDHPLVVLAGVFALGCVVGRAFR